MGLPVATSWFERTKVDDAITLVWEPHVVPLMRCNIWHVAGRDRDLLVDTGMGVASIVEAVGDLFEHGVTAVATHGHDDHIGGHHEFDDVVAHPLEASSLETAPLRSLHIVEAWGQEVVDVLEASGYPMHDEYFVDALPVGVALETFRQRPARVTRLVDEGDVIDLGDRVFEVLHLPGHSPGSIGLWEAATGTLFSGDAIYDGPLLDELPESDIAAYCATMERLIALPATVVHGGHEASFGRQRLVEICDRYLALRG